MRIVVTGTRGIPDILGGVETHCEELFPRIARKDIDVTLIQEENATSMIRLRNTKG